MNKDLKQRVVTFLQSVPGGDFEDDEARVLVEILTRGRGRKKGFKLPKKPVEPVEETTNTPRVVSDTEIYAQED